MYHLVILQLTKEKEFCFKLNFLFSFAVLKMVVVAQLVRASDCDSEGRGFEPHHPHKKFPAAHAGFFFGQKIYKKHLKTNEKSRLYFLQNLC